MALTDNLLAFYKLDNLTDSSGNGNTLTNNGGVTFSSGKIGNAADFDGTNSLDSNFVIPDTGDFTIASWFNLSQEQPFALLGNGLEWGSGFIELGSSDPGLQDQVFRVYITDYTTSGAALASDAPLNLASWNHIILKRSGSTFNMWINGVLQASTFEYSGGINSGSGLLTIGKSTYTHHVGQIDAVGIWNRALNSTEVAELYNSGNGLEEFGGAPATQSFIKIQDSAKFLGKVKFIS